MLFRWSILLAAFALLASPLDAVEMELTAANLQSVMNDFANEIAKIETETATAAGRRSLLGVTEHLPEIPPIPYIGDWSLDHDLTDFVAGLINSQIHEHFKDAPETYDDWEKLIKDKYKDFCADPQKKGGEKLLAKCEGPEITFELVPGKCEVVDREKSEYACESPYLEYRRSGPECVSSHRQAAKFIDKECKFVHQLGVEKQIVLGGGAKDAELHFGKQHVGQDPNYDLSDILDIVSGLYSDLLDFPHIADLGP